MNVLHQSAPRCLCIPVFHRRQDPQMIVSRLLYAFGRGEHDAAHEPQPHIDRFESVDDQRIAEPARESEMKSFVGIDQRIGGKGGTRTRMRKHLPFASEFQPDVRRQAVLREPFDDEKLQRQSVIVELPKANRVRLLHITARVGHLAGEPLCDQRAKRFAYRNSTGRKLIADRLFPEMRTGRIIPIENALSQSLENFSTHLTAREPSRSAERTMLQIKTIAGHAS